MTTSAGGFEFSVTLVVQVILVETCLTLFPFTVLYLTIRFCVWLKVPATGSGRFDWTSTVPEALTVPTPGLYGVHSDVHR